MEKNHLNYKNFKVPLTVEYDFGKNWGESHQMIKRKKQKKKNNPIAKELSSPKYMKQVIKSKKIYDRKKKSIA